MRGKRNWRRWWLGYISHAAIGFTAARLMRRRPAEGAGLLGLSIAYQALEFAKYRDSVAVDLKDHLIGFGLGLALNALEVKDETEAG